MLAVALALCSALLFGAMTVVLRFALRRSPARRSATLATIRDRARGRAGRARAQPRGRRRRRGGSSAVPPHRDARARRLAAPVHDRGARRRALADVGGGRRGAARLGRDRDRSCSTSPPRPRHRRRRCWSSPAAIAARLRALRPAHYRVIGLVFALAGATLFAIRDNIVRWPRTAPPSRRSRPPRRRCFGGSVVIVAYLLVLRRPPRSARSLPFVPVGVLLRALVPLAVRGVLPRPRDRRVADRRDRVALGRPARRDLHRPQREIGLRLVAGAVCIVAGGALIGVVR